MSGVFETKFNLFSKSLVIIPATTVIRSFLFQINGIALYGEAAKKILTLQADNRTELWGLRTALLISVEFWTFCKIRSWWSEMASPGKLKTPEKTRTEMQKFPPWRNSYGVYCTFNACSNFYCHGWVICFFFFSVLCPWIANTKCDILLKL